VALRHPGWEDPRDFRSLAARRPQGGRAADDGSGEGGVIDAVREYVTPNIIMDTSGGDPYRRRVVRGAARRRCGVVCAAAAATTHAAQERAVESPTAFRIVNTPCWRRR